MPRHNPQTAEPRIVVIAARVVAGRVLHTVPKPDRTERSQVGILNRPVVIGADIDVPHLVLGLDGQGFIGREGCKDFTRGWIDINLHQINFDLPNEKLDIL